MKKFLVILIAVLMVLPLFAQGAAESKATETIVLKLGTPAPAGSMNYNNAVLMKEKLEELSGGTMTLDIVPGAALGNVPQHFSQISQGTLDFFVVGSDASIAFKGGEDFFILGLPFLFRDEDHFNAFLKSDVLAEMSKTLEDASGIKLMGRFGARNPRGLSTTKTAVYSPSDLKGLIIRIPENAMLTKVWSAYGASTAQSSSAEIFSGLQSGMFDGQENGVDTVVDLGLTSIQKYYMELNQAFQSLFLWMSSKTWNKLTAQQQEWVTAAIAYADETATAAFETETLPKYVNAIKESGMTYITNAEINVQAFIDATKSVVPELEGNYFSVGLYDKIQAIK